MLEESHLGRVGRFHAQSSHHQERRTVCDHNNFRIRRAEDVYLAELAGTWTPLRKFAQRLLILRNLWTAVQTQQAFESEEQFLHRKNNILAKQSASNYLTNLDEDNKDTEFIGKDVTWGTPVEEKADDPFIPNRSGA